MDTREHLQQLKKLQITDQNEIIFHKHKTLLEWIDKVAPLLKYNDEHYSLFMDAALNVSVPGISSRTGIPCLNIMKGVVNRAIIELENDIKTPKISKSEELKYPEKLTLYWLIKNVPAHLWISFFILLATIFTLGITFSHTKLYKSLMTEQTAITKENNKIPKTKE